jgi:hypothetical protein
MPSFRVEMYYIYSYLREDNSPYYIGKGKEQRAYTKGRNEVRPPKDKSRVRILKDNLTEQEAFELEKLYILMFGRKDNGTGILRNKTDGGDGSSGAVRSAETRRKISEAHKGRIVSKQTGEKISRVLRAKNMKHSEEHKKYLSEKLKGRKCTEEHKRKVSEAKKGFRHTEEAKRKMSENSKGKKHTQEWKDGMSIISKSHAKPHRITFNDGRVIEVENIQDWGKENGYRSGGISRVKTGVRNKYRDIIKIEVIV